VISALTRVTAEARFWGDLEDASKFLQAEGKGVISFVHLYVKAAALAVLASPFLHRQFGLFRVTEPAHAAVGVSAAGRRVLAPVVVIDEADKKSLQDIATELGEKASRARSEERKAIPRLDQWMWTFPFPALRRFITRWVLLSPRRRRKILGTIQVSDLSHFGIDMGYSSVVGELLLLCGSVDKRVVVGGDDLPAVRTGAWFTLQGSHQKVNGRTAGKFIARFRELLAHPETLV
jgi:pyruvate/2-oxoglutarate dehydrogenase complex dihydrolipoamide acyltransferase (E2) component